MCAGNLLHGVHPGAARGQSLHPQAIPRFPIELEAQPAPDSWQAWGGGNALAKRGGRASYRPAARSGSTISRISLMVITLFTSLP